MSLELVVSGAVGAGVLYYWGLRRIGRMRGIVYRQRNVNAFRAARARLEVDAPYRIATEPALIKTLDVASGQQAALAALGFSPLGELELLGPGGAPAGVMRALVDAERTVCAAVMVAWPIERVLVQLTSFGETATFITQRGKVATLADAPSMHRQVLALVPMPELLAQHLAFATDRLPVTSLEDLVSRLNAVRAVTQRWRAAQQPDELLDADLRVVLGAQYARWGKVWAARIRDELPQARLR